MFEADKANLISNAELEQELKAMKEREAMESSQDASLPDTKFGKAFVESAKNYGNLTARTRSNRGHDHNPAQIKQHIESQVREEYNNKINALILSHKMDMEQMQLFHKHHHEEGEGDEGDKKNQFDSLPLDEKIQHIMDVKDLEISSQKKQISDLQNSVGHLELEIQGLTRENGQKDYEITTLNSSITTLESHLARALIVCANARSYQGMVKNLSLRRVVTKYRSYKQAVALHLTLYQLAKKLLVLDTERKKRGREVKGAETSTTYSEEEAHELGQWMTRSDHLLGRELKRLQMVEKAKRKKTDVDSYAERQAILTGKKISNESTGMWVHIVEKTKVHFAHMHDLVASVHKWASTTDSYATKLKHLAQTFFDRTIESSDAIKEAKQHETEALLARDELAKRVVEFEAYVGGKQSSANKLTALVQSLKETRELNENLTAELQKAKDDVKRLRQHNAANRNLVHLNPLTFSERVESTSAIHKAMMAQTMNSSTLIAQQLMDDRGKQSFSATENLALERAAEWHKQMIERELDEGSFSKTLQRDPYHWAVPKPQKQRAPAPWKNSTARDYAKHVDTSKARSNMRVYTHRDQIKRPPKRSHTTPSHRRGASTARPGPPVSAMHKTTQIMTDAGTVNSVYVTEPPKIPKLRTRRKPPRQAR